jgi:UPF0755 protein
MRKWIVIAVIVIVAVGGLLAWKAWRMVMQPNLDLKGKERYELFIKTGSTFEDVLEQLRKDEVLMDEKGFVWVAELKKYPNKVKPGRYLFKPGLNNNDLVNILRSGGQVAVDVRINHVETVRELCSVVGAQLELDSIALWRLLNDEERLAPLGLKPVDVLTMFMPNTYEMYWNSSAEAFFEKMYTVYHQFWTDKRLARAKEIGMSPQEVYILASIVEKETMKRAEQKTIAGLYMNRIRKGWPLQSDPTVIFALKQLYPDTTIRRVLRSDTEIDSPYNTYLILGLPPGPIVMPHPSAIDAVLHYERHSYMYMCASAERPGYHSFAATLDEHNANQRRYARWMDERRIYR